MSTILYLTHIEFGRDSLALLPELLAGIGVTRPFVAGGHFEWGLALVARRDLFTDTMVRPESSFLGGVQPGAVYEVGGTMIGAALTLGFRFGDAV